MPVGIFRKSDYDGRYIPWRSTPPRYDAHAPMVRLSRSVVMLVGVLALAACKRHRGAPPPPLAPGEVPRVTAPIVVDGELHERDWNAIARVAVFTANGAEARPYSQ